MIHIFDETLNQMGEMAAVKLAGQRASLLSHLIRSILAGMYVGAAIVLIYTIGGLLNASSPGLVRILMGICFGGALTMVIFAGSELFTGSNLVLTLGVLERRASLRDLFANWTWTWIGNLIGSVLLAYLVYSAGVVNADPVKGFILTLVEKKMTLPAGEIFFRAILANWLVCLGVWMATRAKSEAGKILLIWWCMFTFITSGYEHSVANMSGLMLGLLLPHGPEISVSGYLYNLFYATAGNIVGGAVFVGLFYWLANVPKRRVASDMMISRTA